MMGLSRDFIQAGETIAVSVKVDVANDLWRDTTVSDGVVILAGKKLEEFGKTG